jgi:hypothetical protein
MQIDFFRPRIHPSQHNRPHECTVVFCSGYNRLVHGAFSVGGSFYQHFPAKAFNERKVNDLFWFNG